MMMWCWLRTMGCFVSASLLLAFSTVGAGAQQQQLPTVPQQPPAPQQECFTAGVRFARSEGIIPAPEPTHALAACFQEALRCKETGESKVILTALCACGRECLSVDQ